MKVRRAESPFAERKFLCAGFIFFWIVWVMSNYSSMQNADMFMENHTYSAKTFQKRSIRSQIAAKDKIYKTRALFRGSKWNYEERMSSQLVQQTRGQFGLIKHISASRKRHSRGGSGCLCCVGSLNSRFFKWHTDCKHENFSHLCHWKQLIYQSPRGKRSLKQKHFHRIEKVLKVLSLGDWTPKWLQVRGKFTSNLAKAKLLRRRHRQNRGVIIQMKHWHLVLRYDLKLWITESSGFRCCF